MLPGKLSRVERAEAALRRLGFDDLRVRHHGDVARDELPVADLARAVTDPLRDRIHAAVTAAGFRFVAVDVAGIPVRRVRRGRPAMTGTFADLDLDRTRRRGYPEAVSPAP